MTTTTVTITSSTTYTFNSQYISNINSVCVEVSGPDQILYGCGVIATTTTTTTNVNTTTTTIAYKSWLVSAPGHNPTMSTALAACSNLASNIGIYTQTVYTSTSVTATSVDRFYTDTSLSSQYVCTSGQYLAYTDVAQTSAHSILVTNSNSDLNPATIAIC